MQEIHVVDVEYPGEDGQDIISESLFFASSRDKAVEWMTKNPDAARSLPKWCFFVCRVEIDDPKAVPHDKQIFGRDGQEYETRREAFLLERDMDPDEDEPRQFCR